MIKQVENQTPKLRLAQDFNQVQWKYKDNYEMMLENEWSCTLSEMLSSRRSTLLPNSYSNGGMEI
jgi:hypothetical protein